MPQTLTSPMVPLGAEPKESAREEDELPLSDAAREALIRRLEAWIEEEERLIEAIERRFAATAGEATPFRGRIGR